VELTTEIMEFLHGIFQLYDLDNDGALRPSEVDNLFDTAPESPWGEAPYKDAAEKTASGNITLNGFLSEWALMTLLDPQRSLANLIYIGYGGNPVSTFRVTRRRAVDRKKKRTERKVLLCYVFGPKKSGKSALLNSFLGRPFSEIYTPTNSQCYATNVVDMIGGTKETLILREIPEDGVKRFLSNKESLAACDVALFVYDSSQEYSWKKSKELLMEVAKQGEQNGFVVPCLLVAAKDDLSSNPIVVQNSIRVTHELGIEPPLSVSVKVRDSHNLLSRIITAAECPHLSIPETEAGKSRRQNWQLVNRSLMFLSVSTAITIVGLAAYRAYVTRRNSS
jgi:Ras family protein T1